MENRTKVRVYYEDTDCMKIVYHANYIKFFERGRTEFFDSIGKPVTEWADKGYNFAVFEMKIKWRQPAKLGDRLDVITIATDGGSEYRKIMEQRIELNGEVLTEAIVDIVCLDGNMQLREFPPGFAG